MASELEVTKRQFYSEYNLLNESDGNMFIEDCQFEEVNCTTNVRKICNEGISLLILKVMSVLDIKLHASYDKIQ